VQFKGIRNKAEYARRETRRFIERHGLTAFRMNPHFPVNTLQNMRGAVAAERAGTLAPYVECVFRAMWEQELKMDDPAVIEGSLAAAGLDARAILAALADDDIKRKLAADTEASVERGNFGSPTFFVGDEMYFGKDRLDDVERAILAAT
jgi:2-hydroxychromene-2-carboxylate isomerase